MEVDLGLARAGDAVQQEPLGASGDDRVADGRQRGGLRRGELRRPRRAARADGDVLRAPALRSPRPRGPFAVGQAPRPRPRPGWEHQVERPGGRRAVLVGDPVGQGQSAARARLRVGLDGTRRVGGRRRHLGGLLGFRQGLFGVSRLLFEGDLR